MSVIEDVRQTLQDFIAPELKSLEARLAALEHQVADAKAEIRAGFADMRIEMRAGFTDTKAELVQLRNYIGLAQRVEAFSERLSRIETQQQQHD